MTRELWDDSDSCKAATATLFKTLANLQQSSAFTANSTAFG
jgi:hypothetical protein